MNEFTKTGIQKKKKANNNNSLFNRKTETVEYTGSTHTHTHTHTHHTHTHTTHTHHTHTPDVVSIVGLFPDPPDAKI